MPIQVKGEVLDVRRAGAYHVLSITAPGIPESFRPGHFVTIGIGGEESGLILRRAFAIHQVQSRGVYGGTLDVVVGVNGKGTRWLSERRRHDNLDIVGPLGKPFMLPKEGVPCVLVGGGYGSAPLFMLAEQLRERGCRVDVVLGASTEEKLYGVLDIKRVSSMLTITTEDGSSGVRGRVTDVLPDIMERNDAAVVYACGPMAMLAAVASIASEYRAYSQCSVEEAMACGIGICMTCVLPVIGDDGVTRMVRSCVDGPIFRGDLVRWDDIGTIPADALGAPVLDAP
ncbi:dihydroorotate dehydrogenase B (NAD(+)), electron transfer subunit [Actinomycetes bacterium]|nr:dihydroorotate dehydrogenase B (NAD(+)), electron transfer subunit [Actinomycetes bacterium]